MAFALEIMSVVDILVEKYHRELDAELLTIWAIRELFEKSKEPLPPQLERKLRKPVRTDIFPRLDVLVEAREWVGDRPELLSPRDADLALQGILRRLDPHTTLLDPEAMNRLNALQNGNRMAELGLIARRLPGSDAVEVVTPLRDGPAHKAGIRAGDVITRMRFLDTPEGKPLKILEEVAPRELVEDEGGRALLGRPNTKVELTVRKPTEGAPQVLTLTRVRLKKEKILGVTRRADDSWDHVLDASKGIYYVRITDFHGPETARELDRLLKSFANPKLRGLILDFRFTGAGLIQTAFDVADLFIPTGVIVEFRSRTLQEGKGRWMARGQKGYAGIPIACLVSEEAGTCTEIVAAALQDHRRARIVGERTSGKASAQNYFPTQRGTLRVTTSHAYRPSGKPLDRIAAADFFEGPDVWGVLPDQGCIMPLSREEKRQVRQALLTRFQISRPGMARPAQGSFQDRQLEKALQLLRDDVK